MCAKMTRLWYKYTSNNQLNIENMSLNEQKREDILFKHLYKITIIKQSKNKTLYKLIWAWIFWWHVYK